jgi:hypothetical protein
VDGADDALELSSQKKGGRLLLRVWRDGGSHFVGIDISKSR